MENIKFDLSKWDDPADKANAIMTFIVNRAITFNHNNYDKICVEIPNTKEGCIIFNLIFAISPFLHIPFYTKKASKRNKFWRKNNLIKFKTKFFYNKLLKKERVMHWSVSYDEGVNLLAGISEENINLIATNLYGWCD